MMNYPVPYVVLKKSIVENDWKLKIKPREKNNGRKVLVNEIFPTKEFPIQNPLWHFGPIDSLTPVLETGFGGIEIAIFTHEAGQDRHKHFIGTEIYTVLEGKMTIRVEDQDIAEDINLEAGDEIVTLPNTIHEVLNEDTSEFLCRVHSINCYGDRDKYVEDVNGAWWQVFTLKNQKGIIVNLKK